MVGRRYQMTMTATTGRSDAKRICWAICPVCDRERRVDKDLILAFHRRYAEGVMVACEGSRQEGKPAGLSSADM
jgi:hypothetical protein